MSHDTLPGTHTLTHTHTGRVLFQGVSVILVPPVCLSFMTNSFCPPAPSFHLLFPLSLTLLPPSLPHTCSYTFHIFLPPPTPFSSPIVLIPLKFFLSAHLTAHYSLIWPLFPPHSCRPVTTDSVSSLFVWMLWSVASGWSLQSQPLLLFNFNFSGVVAPRGLLYPTYSPLSFFLRLHQCGL